MAMNPPRGNTLWELGTAAEPRGHRTESKGKVFGVSKSGFMGGNSVGDKGEHAPGWVHVDIQNFAGSIL